jgi:hypothetical protein
MFKRCERIVAFFNGCGAAKKALELEQISRGNRVYKLIRSTETRTLSSVYAKVYGLAPPLGPLVIEAARTLHGDLELQIKSRFPFSENPNATLVAMFLNPGCFCTQLFTEPSAYLEEAKGLTRRALLTLARETDGQPASVSVLGSAPIVAGGALARLRSTTYMYRAEQESTRYTQAIFEDPAAFGNFLDTPHAFLERSPIGPNPASKLVLCLPLCSGHIVRVRASFQQGRVALFGRKV